MYVLTSVYVPVTARMWKSEDSFQKSVLSFNHVGSRAGTQIVRLGGEHLYLLIITGARSPEQEGLMSPTHSK